MLVPYKVRDILAHQNKSNDQALGVEGVTKNQFCQMTWRGTKYGHGAKLCEPKWVGDKIRRDQTVKQPNSIDLLLEKFLQEKKKGITVHADF